MLLRYLYRVSLKRCRQNENILIYAPVRDYSSQAELKRNVSSEEQQLTWQQARPYSEIPGPSKFQLLRDNLPGGKFYKQSYDKILIAFRERYGKLYRIPGLFGKDEIIMCTNPADYPTIFRNEGIWPERRGFDTVTYHREVYRADFFQGVEGVVTTNGEKWAKIRSKVNPILLQPKNVGLYLNSMQEVNKEFLQRIREIRDPISQEMPYNFKNEIKRLFLESAAVVALNKQLGLLRKNRNTEESKTLIKNIEEFFDLFYQLDRLPSIWKYIRTPKFKRIMSNLDVLLNFSTKYVDETIAKIEKSNVHLGEENSVLEKLLRHDRRLATVMALDIMMGGIDTTTTSLTGILLGIAKSPDKQQKLREEICSVLPHKDSVFTLENMKNLPYLRACIKEGIRFYPVSPGTSRILPVDVVLSGFQVPNGTNIVIGSNLLLRDGKYVSKPNDFWPERWLRSNENRKTAETIDPFVYNPFGFGPRSCIGKRIVDLELEITVARLVRNFNIEFNYSIENAFKAKLVTEPIIPLKFKFEEIPE